MLVAKWIDRVRFSILLLAAAVLIGQATVLTASDEKATSSKAKINSDAWETPEEMPKWLSDSLSKISRADKCRSALSKPIDAEYESVSLVKVIKELQEKLDTPFTIALPELDLLGIDHATPVTIKAGKMPVGEMLDLLLEPLNLTYVVNSTGVSITSKQAANSAPTTRFFEMSWAIDSEKEVKDLVNLVQITVDPDSWISNGGVSTAIPLGSVLVVSAPSSTQRKIENLLANLAKLKQIRQKKNSIKRLPSLE